MRLAVVILNWNAANDTLRCVKGLAAWCSLQPQIIVVDNNSHDGSVEAIRQADPGILLIANPTNQGFSGGTNRGIEVALTAGAEAILLLNNDATISEDAVARLVATLADDGQVGVVGPLLYADEAYSRILSAGNKNPVLYHHNLQRTVPPGAKLLTVDYISGSVALIRADLLQRVGLLDERYFFNTEVADLCRRARQAGWRCVVNVESRAYHVLERSGPLRSTLYTYYLVRNRFLYIRKFYRLLRLPLIGVWAVYSLLLAAKLRLGNQKGAAVAVWLGLLDGVVGRWGGQNERVLAACKRAQGQS